MEKFNHLESFKNVIGRFILSATLLTAPILSTGCGRDGYNPERQQIREELDELKSAKNLLNEEYNSNPELISNPEFFEKLLQIYIYEEYLGYCERENINAESFDGGIIDKIEAHFRDIIEKVKVETPVESTEDMFNLMAQIKKVFHESIGRDDAYDKDHPNIVDPIFEKAFQCRSGSEFILYLTSRYHEETAKFRLVRIFTNGHQIPGFIDENNNLIGVESTSKGKGEVNFGNLDQIEIPIVVTDYRHDLASQIISDVEENNIIIKNSPTPENENTIYKRDNINSWLGVHNGRGFGYVEVPSGRRDLVELNSIPYVRYNEPYDFYSAEDKTARDMEVSPEISRMVSVYNIEYQSQLNSFWSKHAELFGNRPASSVEYENIAKDLIAQIDDFLKTTGAEEAYQKINQRLKQEGKMLSIKSPYEIRDSILHNLNIGLNKY